MILTDKEKKELEKLTYSSQLRNDFRKLVQHRYNPFIVNGIIDLDKVVLFLAEYNNFIGHWQKPFRKIIMDKVNKL